MSKSVDADQTEKTSKGMMAQLGMGKAVSVVVVLGVIFGSIYLLGDPYGRSHSPVRHHAEQTLDERLQPIGRVAIAQLASESDATQGAVATATTTSEPEKPAAKPEPPAVVTAPAPAPPAKPEPVVAKPFAPAPGQQPAVARSKPPAPAPQPAAAPEVSKPAPSASPQEMPQPRVPAPPRPPVMPGWMQHNVPMPPQHAYPYPYPYR